VSVVRTPPAVLQSQLKAWDKVLAEHSKDPFFARVIDSQKSWVKRTGAFLQANNLDSSELAAAYRHFFG
jgi:TRAP-type mannitol/chloroaromatic compound transport system substrate-binding protein